MSFINKNVNIVLLLLIVVIVLSFVSITTYYQSTYQNLSKSFNTKLSEIESLTQTLSVRRTELNTTYTELQIRMADKARFDKIYSDVVSQKELAEAELASTKVQLKDTQDALTTSNLKLEETQNKVNELQRSIEEYQSRVTSLQSQIDSLKAKCGAACQ